MRENFVGDLARGYTKESPAAWDPAFVEDLVDRLFQDPNNPNLGGLDLTALNIQRARDWGIPSYNEYRGACQKTVSRGENLNSGGTFGKVNDFDDIDLFIGAVLEAPVGDSILGPTFRCLVANQF